MKDFGGSHTDRPIVYKTVICGHCNEGFIDCNTREELEDEFFSWSDFKLRTLSEAKEYVKHWRKTNQVECLECGGDWEKQVMY